MTNWFLLSRKIHRLLVPVIIVLTAIMAFTGIALKYGFFSNSGLTRYVHNNLSVLFTIVLVATAVTGAHLYVYPIYIRRLQAKREQNKQVAPKEEGR